MENTSLILTSSNPLPNKLVKLKRLYWACLGLICLGVFADLLLAVGIIAILVLYVVDYYATTLYRGRLRTLVFKYNDAVSQDELFAQLQSVLISKYKGAFLLERNADGEIVLNYDGHIYDIHIQGDQTFTIWWRKSLAKAMFSLSDYKSYKKILAAYGIIAYEIQQISGVAQSKEMATC